MYISNETPTGSVDWINKVFTTAYNIWQIDTVYVWTVPYFDFTFTWTVLTLTDAPEAWTSVYLNYYTVPSVWNSNYLSVTEAKVLLERHIDDTLPEISSDLFMDWINNLNKFVFRATSRLDPTQYRTRWIINTADWIADYQLPSDFRDMNVLGTWIYKTNTAWDVTDNKLVITDIWSQVEWYYLDGRSIVFTPKPWSEKKYFMYYIPRLQELVDDLNSTVIDREYTDFLTKALKVTYYWFITDQWSEVFEDQKFERVLNEYLQHFQRTPKVYKI